MSPHPKYGKLSRKLRSMKGECLLASVFVDLIGSDTFSRPLTSCQECCFSSSQVLTNASGHKFKDDF